MTAGETATLLNRMISDGRIEENTPIVYGVPSKHIELANIKVTDVAKRDENGRAQTHIRKVLIS